MLKPQNLQRELETRYDLVCFQDLAEVMRNHSALFRLLDAVHCDCYQPNQRLVFYTSHDLDQLTADHLQRAVSKIDISNWFVIICSNRDQSHLLAEANRRYGYDGTAITCRVVDLEPTPQIDSSNLVPFDHVCALPFSALEIVQSGSVRPCCRYNQSVGSIKTHSADQVFRGPAMTLLRQQFRQGMKPHNCSYCWQQESKGSSSLRTLSLDRYLDRLEQCFDEVKTRHLTLAQANQCNFRCRMCSPQASSSIAQEQFDHADASERKRLEPYLHRKKWHQSNTFVAMLEKSYPDLENLSIYGGEPMLIKGTKDVLEGLVANGWHRRTRIDMSTNASVWNHAVIDLLQQFCEVELSLSIDDVGQRFELQRGGNWPAVLTNIKKFVALKTPNFRVQLTCTINIQNVLYLDDVVALAHDLGIGITWNYAMDPEELCVDHMTKTACDLAHDLYQQHALPELQTLARRLQQCQTHSDGQQFRALMQQLDRRRSQRFNQYHSEIWSAMGGQPELSQTC